jgi:hypothetical protein
VIWVFRNDFALVVLLLQYCIVVIMFYWFLLCCCAVYFRAFYVLLRDTLPGASLVHVPCAFSFEGPPGCGF